MGLPSHLPPHSPAHRPGVAVTYDAYKEHAECHSDARLCVFASGLSHTFLDSASSVGVAHAVCMHACNATFGRPAAPLYGKLLP